jgi:hypothetical protein
MTIKLKKINKEEIKVIPVSHAHPDEILGYDIFPTEFCNIFICASQGSGKTNTVNKICEKCINKDTKVFVFASTHNIDDNWKYIKQQLEKRNIAAVYYSSIEENGIDNLEQLMLFMENEAMVEEQQKQQKEENINDYIQVVKVDYDIKSFKVKVKPKKKKAPKYMIIFDDMSSSLKKRNVPALLKKLRHFKSKVIVSTQYLNDLGLDSRSQVNYWLLFKGQSTDKLENIYETIGTNMSFEDFYLLYKKITDQPYTFMYINKVKGEFRKNFNELIEISAQEDSTSSAKKSYLL